MAIFSLDLICFNFSVVGYLLNMIISANIHVFSVFYRLIQSYDLSIRIHVFAQCDHFKNGTQGSLMGFPMHNDIISMELSILILRGHN